MSFNLANILTLFRLFLLPFIIVLFFLPFEWAAWSCLVLYILGAVTDYLDGIAARQYNQVSDFGQFLDPISDKIFVVTIMLMLVAVDRVEGAWVLAIMIILIREFLVAGLREFLAPRGIALPVTGLAKYKTATQMIAIGVLIVAPYAPFWPYAVHTIGLIGLVIAAALTVCTGYIYLRDGLRHIVS